MQEKNKAVTEPGAEEQQVGQWDELARNMVRLFDQGTKVLGSLAERSNDAGPYSMAAEAGEATKSLGEIARHWVSEPGKLAAAQSELFKDYAELWGRSVRRCLGEGREAGDRARARRQSLQGPGLVEYPVFRFLEAGLSADGALGRGSHAQDRRRRRQDQEACPLLSRADACGAIAVELRADQPRSGARHARHERGEFGARHDASRP